MKKNYILLALLLIVVGCQKDEDIKFENQESTSEIIRERLTQDKITEKSKTIKNFIESVEKVQSSRKPEKSLEKSSFRFHIFTNSANYFEKNGYHSYTFEIWRPNGKALENIVFSLQADGSYNTYLITYDLTRQEKESLLKGENIPMADKATIISIDISNPRELLNKGLKSTTCYEPYECTSQGTGWEDVCFGEVPCEDNNATLDDGSNGGGGDTTPGDTYPYSDGSNYDDGTEYDTGGSGGGTTTGGSGGDYNPDDGGETTLPLGEDRDTSQYEENPAFYDLNLTLAERDWLNYDASYIQKEQLENFLLENSNSLEAKKFAEEAVRAWMAGGKVDVKKRLINNPLLHDFLKDRMSSSELELFNTLTTAQKGLYLQAAAEAYAYAEIFYPQPVRNRKGDAVKHTLWNALSTIYIGATLTKQLTDAHEEITFDSGYQNHYKEKQMDLYNNAKGRELGNQYGGTYAIFFQLVENAKNDGNLRYLNHLEFTGSFWRATSNSVLTPTNQ